MKQGESIEEFIGRTDKFEITMGFIPVLNIIIIIVCIMYFIFDFIYSKIKHWRKCV
jgi:hypothetical protein